MEKYVDVYTASDITFAYLMKAQLENAGIPVQVANETVSAIYSLDGMAPRVQVPAEREAEALAILAEMRAAAEGVLPDDEDDDEDEDEEE